MRPDLKTQLSRYVTAFAANLHVSNRVMRTLLKDIHADTIAQQPPAAAQAQGGGEFDYIDIANRAQEITGRSIWPSTAKAVLKAAGSPAPPSAPVGVEIAALRVQEWFHAEHDLLVPVQEIEAAMRTPCSCPDTEHALAQQPAAVDDELQALPEKWRNDAATGVFTCGDGPAYCEALHECASELEAALAGTSSVQTEVVPLDAPPPKFNPDPHEQEKERE